jgi:hypothetical protein
MYHSSADARAAAAAVATTPGHESHQSLAMQLELVLTGCRDSMLTCSRRGSSQYWYSMPVRYVHMCCVTAAHQEALLNPLSPPT